MQSSRPDKLKLLRVRYALAFARELQNKGFDARVIWTRAGLAPEALEDPEAWMPIDDLFRFLETAMERTGYTTLGLNAGIAPRQQHSEFSLKLLLSPSLYETLSSICRHASEEDTSVPWRLVRDDSVFWMQAGRMEGPDAAIRQVEFYRYACILELVRYAAGPDWLPAQVEFQSSRDSEALESEFLAQSEACFDRPHMQVSIPPLLLSHSLDNIPDAPLGRSRFSESPVGFQNGLLEVLRYQVLSGKGRLEDTAEALGLSKRTLQRRLADQSVTYTRLILFARMDTAKVWLAHEDKPIAEIASRLGYGKCTNFSRAFRKINGVTPREFRQLVNTEHAWQP